MNRIGLGLLGCLMLAATGCCCTGGTAWSCVDPCDTWSDGDPWEKWMGYDSDCEDYDSGDGDGCPCCGRRSRRHRRHVDPCSNFRCDNPSYGPATSTYSGPVTYGPSGHYASPQYPLIPGAVLQAPIGTPAPIYGSPAYTGPVNAVPSYTEPLVQGQVVHGPVLGMPIASETPLPSEGVTYDSAWTNVPPPAAPPPAQTSGLNEPSPLPPAVPGTQPVGSP